MTPYRVELNGRAAELRVLQELAFAGYGHFRAGPPRRERSPSGSRHGPTSGYCPRSSTWPPSGWCTTGGGRGRTGSTTCSSWSWSRPAWPVPVCRRRPARFTATTCPGFQSAVLMNSIAPARPVAGIDKVELPDHKDLLAMVRRAYTACEAQPRR